MDVTEPKLPIAELYKITTTDGSVALFTSHDAKLTVPAQSSSEDNIYCPIPIKRGPIRYHMDLQVDKVDITFGIIGIYIGDNYYSVPKIIRNNFLRNAHVIIYLFNYETMEDPTILFEGWVTGAINYDASTISFQVGSILDKLNERFPKVLYTENCNHQLFSEYCGLNKESYKETGFAGLTGDSSGWADSSGLGLGLSSGLLSSKTRIYSDLFISSTYSESYWILGEIRFTSGANENISRSIIKQGEGWVEVLVPFPNFPDIGDAFEVYPGCDKSGEMCEAKFDNYDNFLGFEYTPKPETLYY